jgi:hypothetical protein
MPGMQGDGRMGWLASLWHTITSRWPTIIGGVLLLEVALPTLRAIYRLIRTGGDIDFVVERTKDPGWIRWMIENIINPPPWLTIPLVLAGLSLILWDTRRQRTAGGREGRADLPGTASQPSITPLRPPPLVAYGTALRPPPLVAYGRDFKVITHPYTPEQARVLLDIIGQLTNHVMSTDANLVREFENIHERLRVGSNAKEIKESVIPYLEDLERRWLESQARFRALINQDQNFAPDLGTIFRINAPYSQAGEFAREQMRHPLDYYIRALRDIPDDTVRHVVVRAMPTSVMEGQVNKYSHWISAFLRKYSDLKDDLVFLRDRGI